MNYDKTIKDTLTHVQLVSDRIDIICKDLKRRARTHDRSKMFSPEVDVFADTVEDTENIKYGSDKYNEILENLEPALTHHYSKNRHHPQWYETWKDVVGYEGIYKISSIGRVKSLYYNKETILSLTETPDGYYRLQLIKDGKYKHFFVHVLVATAFIENDSPSTKIEVNHKNGIKTDNAIKNLEWVTPSQNIIHAYDTGLRKAKVKYIIKCNELGIITEGCEKMAMALREKGYKKVYASSIWACINGKHDTHLDLTFDYIKPSEIVPSPLSQMTLIDIIEMLCDWSASTMRYKEGNLLKSISINTERFNISPDLASILRNTAELFELLPEQEEK